MLNLEICAVLKYEVHIETEYSDVSDEYNDWISKKETEDKIMEGFELLKLIKNWMDDEYNYEFQCIEDTIAIDNFNPMNGWYQSIHIKILKEINTLEK